MQEPAAAIQDLYDVRDRTVVITGGSGVLGSAMARGLGQAGMRVAVLGRRAAACEAVAATIRGAGGAAIGVSCDVLDRLALERAAEEVTAALGAVEVLINAAGGNQPGATTSREQTFFDLDVATVRETVDLNFLGTFLSCQVFGRAMATRGTGCIVNVASMTALRPLTRVPAYGAAKAAVANFTAWLAVHIAQEYNPAIRVNALAPGFFLTEQNRFLLTDAATGQRTARGQAILDHTPAGRFGSPDDLLGTLLWLVSPASAFVTGIVVPVDGGFSAYGGV
jgi:NAD(P)-dependent dehydrogenase (short-subunit alcohol dehydrogenase family)